MRQREHFGNMNERLKKYRYEDGRLSEERQFYGRAEIVPARCLFSQIGVASRETLEIFTHISCGLSPETPVEYEGEFYVISGGTLSENRLYTKLKAGRARRVLCKASEETEGLDEFRRPVRRSIHQKVYDGFLLERYNGNIGENEGHGITAQRMVLLLPKGTEHKTGEVLEADGEPYVVTARFLSGRYWNEYEVILEADR